MNHVVPASAAVDAIALPIACLDHVDSRPSCTGRPFGARGTVSPDQVAAGSAGDRVGTRPAVQRVISGFAGKTVAAAPAERDVVLGGTELDVIPAAADLKVVASAAPLAVRAGVAKLGVVAGGAALRILAGAALLGVVARCAALDVVPPPAMLEIITGAADLTIRAAGPDLTFVERGFLGSAFRCLGGGESDAGQAARHGQEDSDPEYEASHAGTDSRRSRSRSRSVRSGVSMPTMHKGYVVALACLTLGVAGCGGDSDSDTAGEDAIRDLMAELETLSRQGDGQAICARLFTPKLAASVERASRDGSCPREVKRNVHTPSAVVRVRNVELTDDRNAIARITVQRGVRNNVFLVKSPAGEWRIRSIEQEPR